MSRLRFSFLFLLLGALLVAGCTQRSGRGGNGGGSSSNEDEASAVDDDDDDEHGDHLFMITTVTLRFEPRGGGDTIYANWADPENDGSPVIDDITLRVGEDYDLEVGFLNESEDPAEDVGPEIRDGQDEHQIFVTGPAVRGPATDSAADAIVEHAYADEDMNGLPLGLQNTITTLSTGSGEMEITLRHLPDEDGNSIKFADLAQEVAEDGFSAIGGANRVQVTFALEVQ